ncbi:MAG: RNA-binding S4 domain-containing protein [Firmicutes bacterium]|nr:RNA-binding S4 domain-containing protein [Bacillota bacterium]
MRLDKFLKVSRLIKRRVLAKEAAQRGLILINNNQAKPGSRIDVGDILELNLGRRRFTVEVVALKDNVRTAEAASLYRVVKDEWVQTKTK